MTCLSFEIGLGLPRNQTAQSYQIILAEGNLSARNLGEYTRVASLPASLGALVKHESQGQGEMVLY